MNPCEKLLWSIALPGFGQLLNGQYVKGGIFIFLEFLINIRSNLNEVIVSSFQGDIEKAIVLTDYQWLMFYPCLYMFSMWDAYRDAGGGKAMYSFLPFVFGAYLGTVGVIYSSNLKLFGALFGPVFLSILFIIIGVGVGQLLQILLKVFYGKKVA